MAEGRFTSILGIGPNIPRRKRRLKCGMRDNLKGNWWFGLWGSYTSSDVSLIQVPLTCQDFPLSLLDYVDYGVVLHGVKLRESLSCGSMPYGNEHSVNVSYGTKRSNADRVLVCPQCYLQVVANTGRVLPLMTS